MPGSRYTRLHKRDRRPDFRRLAQRDRDRVLFSSAFRRLGHVTQVVSPTEGIVFHNRLTHSLEVAQIGRHMAERLTCDEEGQRKAKRLGGIDPDVVEAAGLVHDLGHPPHGHVVEQELDDILFHTHGMLDGYEGNAQSFRVVTKLAMRHSRMPGLNLTRATLAASLKYPRLQRWKNSGSKSERQHGKWGAYHTEKREFEWAREIYSGLGGRPCVEAEIMDWADDVAYSVHDVDDFYRAGLIPLDRLYNPVIRKPSNQPEVVGLEVERPEVERFCRYAASNLKDKLEGLKEEDVEEEDVKDLVRDIQQEDKKEILVKMLLDRVVKSGPVSRPYAGTIEQRQRLRTFTAGLISKYVTAVNIADDPNDAHLLKVPPILRTQVEVLKQLTWFYVIDGRALKTQQYGQRKIVRDLFEIYHRAASSDDKGTRYIFPESHRERLDLAGEEPERIVADLISSMTEYQLTRAHRKLTGIDPGSISDLL